MYQHDGEPEGSLLQYWKSMPRRSQQQQQGMKHEATASAGSGVTLR
jgi:hypothetical protein